MNKTLFFMLCMAQGTLFSAAATPAALLAMQQANQAMTDGDDEALKKAAQAIVSNSDAMDQEPTEAQIWAFLLTYKSACKIQKDKKKKKQAQQQQIAVK